MRKQRTQVRGTSEAGQDVARDVMLPRHPTGDNVELMTVRKVSKTAQKALGWDIGCGASVQGIDGTSVVEANADEAARPILPMTGGGLNDGEELFVQDAVRELPG